MANPPSGGLVPAPRQSRTLRAAAYGAALLALLFATVSLYWALGGTALLNTVGMLGDQARRGGPAVITVGLVLVAVKSVGGLLALALVRPWGQRLSQRLLRGLALTGGLMLTLYGGVLVLAGALVVLC